MKAKIMALILAVGLGTVGIAATAQAAAADGCTHPDATSTGVVTEIRRYYNPQEHQIWHEVGYRCKSCGAYFTLWSETREPHDYEQIYYDDGRVLSYCTGCDDSYFF